MVAQTAKRITGDEDRALVGGREADHRLPLHFACALFSSGVNLLQYGQQGCFTYKSELCLAAEGLLCLTRYPPGGTVATALQHVSLKHGNGLLLKFCAGIKVDINWRQSGQVPGLRIKKDLL